MTRRKNVVTLSQFDGPVSFIAVSLSFEFTSKTALLLMTLVMQKSRKYNLIFVKKQKDDMTVMFNMFALPVG